MKLTGDGAAVSCLLLTVQVIVTLNALAVVVGRRAKL